MIKQLIALPLVLNLLACDGAAKDAVRDQLNDPGSAKFYEVGSKGSVTCGLVNAKNRMGGFVGRRGFIFENGIARIEGDQDIGLLGEIISKCPESLWEYSNHRMAQIVNEMRAANDHA